MDKAIETEEEYHKCLARLGEIFHAAPDSEEGREADKLSNRILDYEEIHFPMDEVTHQDLEKFLADHANED